MQEITSVIAKTIRTAKINRVSIGAHPGFKDKKNFGRKRLNLSQIEIHELDYKTIGDYIKYIKKN